MKQFSSEMKSAITKILTLHSQLEVFEGGDEFHLRLEKENFLPLVIERHGHQVTVTHYQSVNGDLVADPDMEFLIGADGEWYPVALQLWNGSYFRARSTDENGHLLVDQKQ